MVRIYERAYSKLQNVSRCPVRMLRLYIGARWKISGSILVFIAASALTACVSNSYTDTASMDSSDQARKVAANDDDILSYKNYRRVVKNGKVYFCSRDSVTGSRVSTTVRCLTKDDIERIQQSSQDYTRDVQSPPLDPYEPNMGPGT